MVATRSLIFSRGVPPVRSDATRRNAPRNRFFTSGLMEEELLVILLAFQGLERGVSKKMICEWWGEV